MANLNFNELTKLESMLRSHGCFDIGIDEFSDENGRIYCKQLSLYARNPYDPTDHKMSFRLADAIISDISSGGQYGLIEISGGLTKSELKQDTVKGWLNAEQVFKRFYKCWLDGSMIYDRRKF